MQGRRFPLHKKVLALVLLIVSQLSFFTVVQAKAISFKTAEIRSISLKQPSAPLPVREEESQEAEEESEIDHFEEPDAELISQLLFELIDLQTPSAKRFSSLNLQKLDLCFFSFHSIQRI